MTGTAPTPHDDGRTKAPNVTVQDDHPAFAAKVIETVAARAGLTVAQIEAGMLLSVWGSVEEMAEREFRGSYRGYFPKCGMHVRAEAVIAEVFDAIAEALGDPRRAMRAGKAERTDG